MILCDLALATLGAIVWSASLVAAFKVGGEWREREALRARVLVRARRSR